MRAADRIAILVVATVLTAATGGAARLPDWAQAIADATPDVESSHHKHSFQVLLSERRVTVHPDGTLTIRDRVAKQALRADTEVSTDSFFLGHNYDIIRSRAWHQPPGKRAKKSSRLSVVDLSDQSNFLSGKKTRTVVMPDVTLGSLVFFEFEATWAPYALSFSHLFASGQPVQTARLVVDTPPLWQVNHQWLRSPGAEPVVDGRITTWQLEDLPGHEAEDLSESMAERAPLLVVGLQPPESEQRCSVPAFVTWGDQSAWFTGLIGDRGALADAAQLDLPAEVATSEAGSPERILAISAWVRDSVRYVAKEIGIGGYQPRPAAETLSTLWGDCKDKGLLLQALLATEGVKSYPLLVNATRPDTVAEEVPTLDAFNHLVVGVALPEQTVLPEGVDAAVVESGSHGRLLVVDVTDEYTTPGWISSSLVGKRSLLVDGPDGELVTLPGQRPQDHRIEVDFVVRLLEDGQVSLARTRRLLGAPAWHLRGDHRDSALDRRKEVEDGVRELWIDAAIGDYSVQMETAGGAFVEHVEWTIPFLPSTGEERTVRLFNGLRQLVPRVSLRRREEPVVYRYPRTVRWTTTVDGVPTEAVPPAARSESRDGWQVETGYVLDGSVLTATFDMRLDQVRHEPEGFTDLRELYSAIAAAARATLVIPQQP